MASNQSNSELRTSALCQSVTCNRRANCWSEFEVTRKNMIVNIAYPPESDIPQTIRVECLSRLGKHFVGLLVAVRREH